MPEWRGKVFAVLGPFENFSDKEKLQQKIEAAVRDYNSKQK
jgi:hypothetical protein